MYGGAKEYSWVGRNELAAIKQYVLGIQRDTAQGLQGRDQERGGG